MDMKGYFFMSPISTRLQHAQCGAAVRLSVTLLWDGFVSLSLTGDL